MVTISKMVLPNRMALGLDVTQPGRLTSGMPAYANLSGDSPIEWYDLRPDGIVVVFRDGGAYLYDGGKPGAAVVDQMKRLATSGRGLSGYISRSVRDGYAARLR